jgi:hypothetical protein
VEGEIEDLGPGAAAGGGRCVLVLLAPDEDLAIVGGGGEDGAEFGVCLGEESVMAIEKWEGGTGGGGCIPTQRTTPRLRAFGSHQPQEHPGKWIALTPSGSQSTGVSRLRFRIS